MNEVLETWRNEDDTKRYQIVYDTYAENPLEDWDERPHLVFFNNIDDATTNNVNYHGSDDTTCKQLMDLINDSELPNVVGYDDDNGMNFIAWRDDKDWTEKPTAESIMSEIGIYRQWRDGNVFGIIEETRHEWHDDDGNTMSTWDVTNSLGSVFYGIEQINPEDVCDAMDVDGQITKVDE